MLLLLVWLLADVLLLAFAGTLLALALLQLSRPLERRLRLSPRVALAAVVFGVAVVAVAGTWFAGAGAAEQLQALREALPRAFQALKAWLDGNAPGRWLLQLWSEATQGDGAGGSWTRYLGAATGTFSATLGALGSAVLAIVIGVYLAADPAGYRGGLLRLVPPSQRERAERALDAAGHDLGRWLLGQAVSMAAVGVLTAIGLAAIGMPLVASLSIIAAVLDFVPYFGPVASGVLIVAVALTEGQRMAFAALLVCVAVQQAEGYVVQPLAQRWAVRLPPVLGMLSVLLFGVLFGVPGVVLAVPLMVLTMTLVKQLYVREIEVEGPPAGHRPC